MSMETWYILNNFSNLDISDNWPSAYYTQAAFGMSCSYLFFQFGSPQQIFLCRKNSMVPYYGMHYIDKKISCIHVCTKKVKLQQFMTNERLLNGALQYLATN